jgi:hypothetical protein
MIGNYGYGTMPLIWISQRSGDVRYAWAAPHNSADLIGWTEPCGVPAVGRLATAAADK